ncbi:hypothetical protein KGF57_000755 [Candida theae]|uniref:Uncharacterized protein n=1 Tax=Candida theae TaxID=1198502 RepID=A0AAD5BIX9_9ASCO|nr:uncharacterized protein KGF57_000755 [Candida theae]KAI5965489.1 hypothetical protein KGF57_000755 [Candida theae]
MDAKETIHLLQISEMPKGFEWEIAKHLKNIEYFSVICRGYDGDRATDKTTVDLKSKPLNHYSAVCGNKNYTRKLEYNDCDYDFHELDIVLLSNLPRNDSVMCLKLDVYNGYRDLESINEVSTLTELYMTFYITHGIDVRGVDMKITLPLQKVYIRWHEPIKYSKDTLNLDFLS